MLTFSPLFNGNGIATIKDPTPNPQILAFSPLFNGNGIATIFFIMLASFLLVLSVPYLTGMVLLQSFYNANPCPYNPTFSPLFNGNGIATPEDQLEGYSNLLSVPYLTGMVLLRVTLLSIIVTREDFQSPI